jgi:hypothetical protein
MGQQQRKLGERELEIDALRNALAAVQQRLDIAKLTTRKIKSELNIVLDESRELRLEKRSAQKLIASLASHTNTLQHAVSSVTSPPKQKRSVSEKPISHHVIHPAPPAYGWASSRPKFDRRPVLCLVDCKNTGVIQGWSLANQCKMITAQTGRGSMHISQSTLQKMQAIVWYPEKDTVPELIESRRGQRLFEMLERLRGDIDKKIEWKPPIVLLVTREKEWQQYEQESNDMRVNCIEPPLTALKLSQYL